MTIKLWHLEKPTVPLHDFKGHFGYVVDIAFNARGMPLGNFYSFTISVLSLYVRLAPNVN